MLRILLTTTALIVSGTAVANDSGTQCSRPETPDSLPDGTSASRSEMLDAKTLVQTFVQEGEAYIACIEDDLDAAQQEMNEAMADGEEEARATARQAYRQLVELHDAMVTDMRETAEAFNQALKDYNSQGE